METMYSSPGFKGSPGGDEQRWIAEWRERLERKAGGQKFCLQIAQLLQAQQALYIFFEFDYIMLENIFYEISDIVDNFSTAERNIAFLTYSIIP